MNATLEPKTFVHIDEPTGIPAPVELESLNINRYKSSPGDDGTTMNTRYDDQDRISKNSPIFAVIGTIFELNAQIGVVRSNTKAGWAAALPVIQQHLGEIQRVLAGDPQELTIWDNAEEKILFLVTGTKRLEHELKTKTNHFPLPGGHPVAANLDLAQAITWRAERAAIGILKGEQPLIVTYLNRLSTVLRLMARRANITYGVLDLYEVRTATVQPTT